MPGIRYGTTARPSVRHFACESRQRLSTAGSDAKTAGLDRFWFKHRRVMSPNQQQEFVGRARRLFDWRVPEVRPDRRHEPGSRANPAALATDGEPLPHLVVGTVADPDCIEEVTGLLSSLCPLARSPHLSSVDVLILENGARATADGALRALVERHRSQFRVHLVDRDWHRNDAAEGLVADAGVTKGQKLAIAPARTVLQTYLYGFAKRAPGALVWIVDSDMRLDPLIAHRDGRLRRKPLDMVAVLRKLQALRGTVDIAIGQCTGAPPVPAATAVRVQLVDLTASLAWLATRDPQSALPDTRAEHKRLRDERRDYYYDVSRTETDRLETPFLVAPAFEGESVGEAFVRTARSAERILAGEQVFRPLVADAAPTIAVGEGIRRGGNTFVLDIESLRLAPNPFPTVDRRPSRRSDMVWALLQQRYFGMRVKTVGIPLYQDRSRAPAADLDVKHTVDDVRGYAIFSALEDSPGVLIATDECHLRVAESEVDAFVGRVNKYVEERLAAFRLSFHRIQGLTRVLRELAQRDDAWWQDREYREATSVLLAFTDRLGRYRPDILKAVEYGARALAAPQVRDFLRQLPRDVDEHRARLAHHRRLAIKPDPERVANARATVLELAGPAGRLDHLGSGSEGVVLSDGVHVFKVFDYWKSWRVASTRTLLGSLVGAWSGARYLYPLSRFNESGSRAVLVYPFEASAPYAGGHGPGMVGLMAECHRYRVVCRNIHPDNLRVVDGRVRLIDYGSDIHPFDEDEFVAMCRRAFLSWRWANRPDLKQTMRSALKTPRHARARRIRALSRGGAPRGRSGSGTGRPRVRVGQRSRERSRLRLRGRSARQAPSGWRRASGGIRPRSGSRSTVGDALRWLGRPAVYARPAAGAGSGAIRRRGVSAGAVRRSGRCRDAGDPGRPPVLSGRRRPGGGYVVQPARDPCGREHRGGPGSTAASTL